MYKNLLMLAVFAAVLMIPACGATGEVDLKKKVPTPIGDLNFQARLGLVPPVAKSFAFEGGGPFAGKCVEVVWSGATGQDIKVEKHVFDGSGTISGPVPPGAVRWEFKVVPCESDKLALAAGGALGGGVQGHGGSARGTIPEHIIIGGTVLPDFGGATNLSYSFRVIGGTAQMADDTIEAILGAGIGASVPQNVQVWHYSEVERVGSDMVTRYATPGNFTSLDFFFNGTGTASLNSGQNVTVSYDNGWEIVDVSVSLTDMDLGLSFANAGVVVYTTTSLPTIASASASLSTID